MKSSHRFLWTAALLAGGCAGPQLVGPSGSRPPGEANLAPTAPYVVRAPDILTIEMEALPSPETVLRVADSVAVNISGALPDQPIRGVFTVQGDGMLELGPYGQVPAAGLSAAKVRSDLMDRLGKEFKSPSVTLVPGGARPISGEYLVRPDGTIKLGFYGAVPVANLTMPQIEERIAAHLEKNYGLAKPRVSVDVAAYNSQGFYIVTDGGSDGDGLKRLPVTGRETVLDALAEVGGLPQTASKMNIWIARPVPGDPQAAEILPVDWVAITKHGAMATNYQLMANDRLYLKMEGFTAFDGAFTKTLAPFERVLGVTTLFSITTRLFTGQGLGNNIGAGS